MLEQLYINVQKKGEFGEKTLGLTQGFSCEYQFSSTAPSYS